MTLELIIREATLGFAFGFAAGVKIDRDVDFKKEFEEQVIKYNDSLFVEYPQYLSGFTSKINKSIPERLESASKKLQLGLSLFTGGLAGMAWRNPYGFLVTVPSAYLGIKAGRFVSRMRRNKAKLGDKESKTFDNYLNELHDATINENYAKQAVNKILLYTHAITLKKKNAGIFKELNNKLMPRLLYSVRYGKIKQFLEKSKEGIGAFALNKQEYDKADALVIHEGKVHLLQLGMDFHDTTQDENIITEIVMPSIKSEVLEWDRTIDGLVKLSDNYGKNRNLMLVNAKEGVPMPLKVMAALNAYADVYGVKKAKDEFVQKNMN